MSCKNTEYVILDSWNKELDSLLYKMKPSKGGISNQKKITEIYYTIHNRSIGKRIKFISFLNILLV